nr:DUF5666 domain-containing protein [Caldimonas mangrovi]
MTELTWGQLTATTARLGHFAEIGFDRDGSVLRARSIRLDAAVAGPVDSVDADAQTLQALGLTVVVNTSPATGPVTVFAGVSGLSDLAAGDLVEVHGVPRWNAQTSRYDVQAGRIEKLTAALSAYRLSGVVQGLQTGASGPTFTLGGLTIDAAGASVLPSGQALENGRRVIVWTAAAPVSGSLQATGIRVIVREEGSSSAPARLGGVVGRLDTGAKTFDVAGVTVTYDGAQVTPPVRPLENGAYVLVRGRYADDGSFVADHVKLRRPSQDDDDLEVRLEGAISDYASDASFLVRGIEVDASGVNARPGCGSQPLANGRRVEVEGEIRAGGSSGSVVRATKLSCVTTP